MDWVLGLRSTRLSITKSWIPSIPGTSRTLTAIRHRWRAVSSKAIDGAELAVTGLPRSSLAPRGATGDLDTRGGREAAGLSGELALTALGSFCKTEISISCIYFLTVGGRLYPEPIITTRMDCSFVSCESRGTRNSRSRQLGCRYWYVAARRF
jgi:hypothetical protein